jgi:hypothetical protein
VALQRGEPATKLLGVDLLAGMTQVRGALAVRLLERVGVAADAVLARVEAQRRRAS